MNQSKLSYQIHGEASQYLVVDLAPNQFLLATYELMMMMDEGISINASNGFAPKKRSHFINKLINTGMRLLKKDNLLLSSFSNNSSSSKKIRFIPAQTSKILPIEMTDFEGEFFYKKGSFLAASSEISVGMQPSRAPGDTFFSKQGLSIAKLKGEGIAFISAVGGVFEKKLQENEVVIVSIPNLLGFSKQVTIEVLHTTGNEKKTFFGRDSFLYAKVKGPGMVFLQLVTMEHLAESFLSFLDSNVRFTKR